MSSIGNITQLLPQPAAPVIPNPAPAAQIAIATSSAAASVDDQVDLNNAQAVKAALQPKAAAPSPTGTFSLFTIGGVLYTRQTQRDSDGSVKVTYEPQYPTLEGSGQGLDIQA